MPFLLFLLAAALFATGGLCMKSSDGLTRGLPSLGVFVFFCAGAACQALGMRRRELGSAYTLVLGLEAVLAVGLASALFGEKLNGGKLGAILLIVLGIVWLERS